MLDISVKHHRRYCIIWTLKPFEAYSKQIINIAKMLLYLSFSSSLSSSIYFDLISAPGGWFGSNYTKYLRGILGICFLVNVACSFCEWPNILSVPGNVFKMAINLQTTTEHKVVFVLFICFCFFSIDFNASPLMWLDTFVTWGIHISFSCIVSQALTSTITAQ